MHKESEKIYTLGDEIGSVTLVRASGTDLDIVNSARVSFDKESNLDEDGALSERDRKLIQYLLQHNHGTPFEHNSLTFRVKCPLFVARQWMRHRMASYNETSARYVEPKHEFYCPKEWRKQSDNNRQASTDELVYEPPGSFCTELGPGYSLSLNQFLNASLDMYKVMIKAGVSREQARMVLPQAMYTEFYYTVNLRSLLHFIDLRIDKGAQWEIQQYAKALLNLAKESFPNTIEIWEKLNEGNIY